MCRRNCNRSVLQRWNHPYVICCVVCQHSCACGCQVCPMLLHYWWAKKPQRHLSAASVMHLHRPCNLIDWFFLGRSRLRLVLLHSIVKGWKHVSLCSRPVAKAPPCVLHDVDARFDVTFRPGPCCRQMPLAHCCTSVTMPAPVKQLLFVAPGGRLRPSV